MLTVTLEGGEALTARLNGLPDKVHTALLAKIGQLTLMLENYVKTQKLSGQVLNVRSGDLRRSINSDVRDAASLIVGRVFSAGDVKYARIHEYGGQTRAHIIEAVNGKALHFVVGGKDVFVKRINHPGSKMPERSFLRSSLAENRDAIEQGIRDAVDGAI